MPATVEKALTKLIHDFMWEEDSFPRIALDALHHLALEGGLNLLSLEAQNEAIEAVWLKAYVNFLPTRPTWAKVTDLIIAAATRATTTNQVRKTSSYRPGKQQ